MQKLDVMIKILQNIPKLLKILNPIYSRLDLKTYAYESPLNIKFKKYIKILSNVSVYNIKGKFENYFLPEEIKNNTSFFSMLLENNNHKLFIDIFCDYISYGDYKRCRKNNSETYLKLKRYCENIGGLCINQFDIFFGKILDVFSFYCVADIGLGDFINANKLDRIDSKLSHLLGVICDRIYDIPDTIIKYDENDFKNWMFFYSLNIFAKAHVVKFMNKMIPGGDIDGYFNKVHDYIECKEIDHIRCDFFRTLRDFRGDQTWDDLSNSHKIDYYSVIWCFIILKTLHIEKDAVIDLNGNNSKLIRFDCNNLSLICIDAAISPIIKKNNYNKEIYTYYSEVLNTESGIYVGSKMKDISTIIKNIYDLKGYIDSDDNEIIMSYSNTFNRQSLEIFNDIPSKYFIIVFRYEESEEIIKSLSHFFPYMLFVNHSIGDSVLRLTNYKVVDDAVDDWKRFAGDVKI